MSEKEKVPFVPTKMLIIGFESAMAGEKPILRTHIVDANGNISSITHWPANEPFPHIDNGFAAIRALALSAARGEVTKAECADPKTPIGEYIAAAKKAIAANSPADTLNVLRATTKGAENVAAGNGAAVADGLKPAVGYVVSLQCAAKTSTGKKRDFTNYSAASIGKDPENANSAALFFLVHGKADAFGGKSLADWQAIIGGGGMTAEQREAMRVAALAAMEAGADEVGGDAPAGGDMQF